MISFSSISKTFAKGSPNELRLFSDFNLLIQPGDFVVLVGSNGSGKSTLLNLLAGKLFPDQGKIYIDQKEITTMKEFTRSRWIARIFQNPLQGTAPELSILENFRLAALRTKPKGLTVGTGNRFRSIVRERLQMLGMGMENKIHQSMGSLSGGQRQALALLMAIMDEAKILLLDEPTAALDPKSSETILSLADRVIREYNLTALLVTHRMKDVLEYGNRIIQLKEGKILRDFRKSAEHELNMKEVLEWFSQ